MLKLKISIANILYYVPNQAMKKIFVSLCCFIARHVMKFMWSQRSESSCSNCEMCITVVQSVFQIVRHSYKIQEGQVVFIYSFRINATNITITRYPSDIARYTMLRHVRQEENLAR